VPPPDGGPEPPLLPPPLEAPPEPLPWPPPPPPLDPPPPRLSSESKKGETVLLSGRERMFGRADLVVLQMGRESKEDVGDGGIEDIETGELVEMVVKSRTRGKTGAKAFMVGSRSAEV